jgi:hypothetical protein
MKTAKCNAPGFIWNVNFKWLYLMNLIHNICKITVRIWDNMIVKIFGTRRFKIFQNPAILTAWCVNIYNGLLTPLSRGQKSFKTITNTNQL